MNEHQDMSQLIAPLLKADEHSQLALWNDMVDQGLDYKSIAVVLEAFPVEQRVRLWRNLSIESHVSVLTEMRAAARMSILNALSETELKLTLKRLDNLALLEWADSLPDEIVNEAMRLLSREELELYDRAIEYNDQHIGHWVEQKVFTLPFGISVRRAKVLLDTYQFDTPKYVYLINRTKQFKGLVLYSDIVRATDNTLLKGLKRGQVTTLDAHQSLADAVDAIEHSDYPVVPVLGSDSKLIGHVDWRFALSTQREQYEARLMAGTGLDENDDLFAPILKGTKKRGLWLGINSVSESAFKIAILAPARISVNTLT